MASPLIWVAAAGAAFVALTAVARGMATDEEDGMETTRKQRFWTKLESVAELDNTQRYTLTLIAERESRYNPAAHNGSASERDAARRGLDNNPSIRQRALNCGVSPEALMTGSWGLFQRLAPFWADDMFDIFGAGACALVDPSRQSFNMNLQIVDAIKVARTLQQYSGWKAFPTVGNLRLGWAAPALMGYITANADRLQRYREDARKARLPAGLVDGPLREFPNDYQGIYARLGGAG